VRGDRLSSSFKFLVIVNFECNNVDILIDFLLKFFFIMDCLIKGIRAVSGYFGMIIEALDGLDNIFLVYTFGGLSLSFIF